MCRNQNSICVLKRVPEEFPSPKLTFTDVKLAPLSTQKIIFSRYLASAFDQEFSDLGL